MSHMVKAKLKIMFEDLDLLEEVLQEANINYTRTSEKNITNISYFQAQDMLDSQGKQNFTHVKNGDVIALNNYLKTYIDTNGNLHHDDMATNLEELTMKLKNIAQNYTVKKIKKKLIEKKVHKKYKIVEEKIDNKFRIKLIQR